mgnify:FL=1
MNRADTSGFSLVELMISMVIAAIVSSILFPALLSFQANSLAEMDRDELHKRAGRLLRYLANDLRDTALFLGPAPHTASGSAVVLAHDSLPGDPVESLATALRPETSGAVEHDALTLVKAVSFAPPIYLAEDATAGASEVRLDRRPNQAPGSSREILPAPEAISHIVLANHKCCYPVAAADQALPLKEPLGQAVPAGTELLGVRAHRYYLQANAGSNRLYRDNYTSRDILDANIDGLQFEYLLRDGSLVDTPNPIADIRGIRVSLLVRSRRTKAEHFDNATYPLGDHSYGPFNDHYRRVAVSQTVEVRNHGLP